MKKVLFLVLLVSSFTFANNLTPNQNNPKVGDVLIINAPKNNTYKHIDLPQLNIVLKRGGVANYKRIYGKVVIVKRVYTNKSGDTKVVLKSKDNTKILGFLKSVKADYSKSINAGELSVLK